MDIGVIIMKPIAGGKITKNLKTALKFVLAHDATLAIPGAMNVKQLDEDIDAAEEFTALSYEERKQYASEFFILGEPYCRQCGYCLPCPSEMNIPEILRMERNCNFFGLKEWIGAAEIGKLQVHPEKCEGCGFCEPRCPFDLPILKMIKNAQQYRQP
jgi:predicted aldo/keto reductase-like oxidoreductase